jgi:hypothetical protein
MSVQPQLLAMNVLPKLSEDMSHHPTQKQGLQIGSSQQHKGI